MENYASQMGSFDVDSFYDSDSNDSNVSDRKHERFKIFDFMRTISPLSLFVSLIVGTSFIAFAEAVRNHIIAPVVDMIIPEDFLDNKLKFVVKQAKEMTLINKTTGAAERVTVPPKIIDIGEVINVGLKLLLTSILCYIILKSLYMIVPWQSAVC